MRPWLTAGTSSAFDEAIEGPSAGYAARFVHIEFVFDEVSAGSNGVRLSDVLPAIQGGDPKGSLCYSAQRAMPACTSSGSI